MHIIGNAQTFVLSISQAVGITFDNSYIVLASAIGLSLFFFTAYAIQDLFLYHDQIGSWVDHMTYHPFAGSHRGYWYRLPTWAQREWLP